MSGMMGRREFLVAAGSGIAQLALSAQEQPKQPQDDLRQRIASLEAKLKDAPKDEAVKKELATAYYDLARNDWALAEDALLKTNGQYEESIEKTYVTARGNAQKALDFTMKGHSFPGIEDRIGRCYLMIGTGYIRERTGDNNKGLDLLRKSIVWGEQPTITAAAKEIFSHYLATRVQDVSSEWTKKGRLKDATLEQAYVYFVDLAKKGQSREISLAKGEDARNVVMFYRELGLHARQKEKDKLLDERKPAFMIDSLFLSYSLTYGTMTDANMKPVYVRSVLNEYKELQKEFPKIKGIQEEFREWVGRQEANMPGAKEFLKAIEN